jgi:hypothetical protein
MKGIRTRLALLFRESLVSDRPITWMVFSIVV